MIKFKKILLIIFSFISSVVIIFLLLDLLNERSETFVNESNNSGISLLKEKYLSCLDLQTNELQFQCQFPRDLDKIEMNNIYSYLSTSSTLISIVYVLIIFALFLQIYILVSSLFFKDGSKIITYFSEWTINAPPMLGVLGTVIAFSLFITQNNTGNITDDFRSTFSDAAKTTILGGSVYIINLYLNSLVSILKEKNA